MKTLDRYIIRYFLINFLILLCVFTMLFVLVDLIVDMDEFVKAGRERAAQFGGPVWATLWTVFDYYGPVLVLLYVFVSGLLVVGAMGFTFAGLGRSRELVAMVSSGISMHRVAAPIVIIGCFLSALTLLSQEFVIPRLAYKLTRSKSQLRATAARSFEVRYAVDSKGHLLSAAQFDASLDDPMLTGVTILERSESGRAVRRITAEQAFWRESYQGWELVGGFAVRPVEADERLGDAVGGDAESVRYFATDLSPKVLLAHRAGLYPRLLSFAELRELASNAAVNDGPLRQIMHSRFSLWVLNVLVLVIGLPFFLKREPGNMLGQGMSAAGVCVGVWGVGVILPEVAMSYMNPVASAWLPVVIFLPISAIGLGAVRT